MHKVLQGYRVMQHKKHDKLKRSLKALPLLQKVSLASLAPSCSGNDVYDFLSSKADSFRNQQWYEMTLDLIESRIYNPPASKTTKTKKFNEVTLCKQSHEHDKH